MWAAAMLAAAVAQGSASAPDTYEADFRAAPAPAPRASGEVVLECVAQAGARIERCTVVSETPAGAGLGELAKAMAEKEQLKARGSPFDGETIRVRVPFEAAPGR